MTPAHRVTIIAALGVAALTATVPASAAASAASSSAHSGSARSAAATARPSSLIVAGRSSHFVVYTDGTHNRVLLGDPAGRRAPRLFLAHARAVALSGNLVEYTSGGVLHWRRIGSPLHGTVPATWNFLAPDGGLRVVRSGAGATVEYRHLTGRLVRDRLPAPLAAAGTHYQAVASWAGIAVVANRAGLRPVVAFLPARAGSRFRVLDTTGAPRNAPLRCLSVVASALGCLSGHSVLRIATDGRTAPQVSTTLATPLRVAVTGRYLTWTAPERAAARACPCTLASVDATGSAQSIITGVTARFLAAGTRRVFYSSGRSLARAGIYAAAAAGTGGHRIAAAAPRR